MNKHKLYFDDEGQGRPIVFIHGWFMSSKVWLYQKELVSDHRVITVDLPGHGKSTVSNTTCTVRDMANSVAGLFGDLDLSNAVVIAWSMGASIAMQMYSALRERLAGLVLVAGTPKFIASSDFIHGLPEKEVKGLAVLVKRNYEKALNDFFAKMFGEGEVSPNQYRLLSEAVRNELPDPSAALSSLLDFAAFDCRNIVPSIKLPVLIVQGSDDRICPAAASVFMAGQLPQAELRIFEGCGHAPFLSRPDDFNAMLRRFLSGV